jgi:uncharacterized protein (DUF1778 family)
MSVVRKDEPLTGRFSLRVSEQDERLIRHGAKQRAVNVSEYLVHAATVQAEIDLADQQEFTLSEDAVQSFFEALEHPARPVDALTDLFARKTVFG